MIKRRILSMMLVVCMVLSMFPVSVFAAELPSDAPFTAITTDAGAVGTIENMGTVTYTGWSPYDDVPYYHVQIPEGATEVYVTHPSSEDPYADANYGSAYGYYAETEGWTGGGMSFAFTEATDGYTITLPLNAMVDTDGDWTADTEGSFVADEDSNVGYAVSVERSQRNDNSPICFFTFEYYTPDAGTEEPVWPFLNIAEITAVTSFEEGEEISFEMWGMSYSAPSYIAEVPEGTETVTVTFQENTHPAIFEDFYTGERTLSGCWVTQNESEEYAGEGTGHSPIQNDEGLYSIELDVATMISEGKYYGAYGTSNNLLYLLGFKYEEGAHTHEYDDGVVTTKPTCTEPGVKTFTCFCGETETKEVAATGHSWDEGKITTKPTCDKAGVETYTCGSCSKTKTEPVAATGHSWGEGEITIEPTCDKAGVETYTCTSCGEIETKEVAATGEHTYAGGTCTVCGAEDPNAGAPEKDENGIYQIATADELIWFAKAVNGGKTAINAVLTEDINLTDKEWPGIGNSSKKFAGSFDGAGYTVNLGEASCGLFGYVTGTSSKRAEIKNVTVEGTIQATSAVGGVAGSAQYVNFTNCVNRANISSTGDAAGITLGHNAMAETAVTITNCINEGDISGAKLVAGILACSRGNATVVGCANTGKITASANNVSTGTGAGGIVGYVQGYKGAVTVQNCYNLGAVSGKGIEGGLIGNLYNNVSIANCYNAGKATYAIAGNIYNNTATATNIYYHSELSTYAAPQNTASAGFNTTVNGVAKSSAALGSEEFVAELSDAFQASCGGPVLTWQTPVEHNAPKGICENCKHGDPTMKAQYKVNKSTGGYEINGTDTTQEGFDYTFTVEVKPGYEAVNMKVYVNGTAVTPNDNGEYTVQPTGHFYITVQGVTEQPDSRGIILPKSGEGYRVKPCEGYTTTVKNGNDFKFTVSFIEGFVAGKNFTVKANDAELTAVDGVYTIENVTENQTITVSGVDIKDPTSVTVKVDVTRGQDAFYSMDETDQILMDQEIEVPYFDLALYDWEKYYYNPYCYLDENGNIRGQQVAGNRETAYNKVTTLHALIYMTEIYYLGLDAEVAGTGYSHTLDADEDGKSDIHEAVNITQPAGSSFMYLWGAGGNLNYHLNYEYPIAYEGWGSTSDQQPLNEEDRISIHFITGSASGSSFGFFAVDDENNTYDKTEQIDQATVKQGEKVKLTHYIAAQGPNYTTAFVTGGNKDLYWVEQYNESAKVAAGENGDWNRDNFGSLSADSFKTDANGEITIDTADIAPGTYYIAALGGFTKGSGTAGSDGFVSQGSESGPAYFKLIVEASDEPAEPEITYGDVNGDDKINATDATLILRYAADLEVTNFSEEAADVNGDGKINATDATLILRYAASLITSFPVEKNS